MFGKKIRYFEDCRPQEDGTIFCRLGYKEPESGRILAIKEGVLVPSPSGSEVKWHREDGEEDLVVRLRERFNQIKREGIKVIKLEKPSKPEGGGASEAL